MKRDKHIILFVEEIWKWFAVNKRMLPWRDLTLPEDQKAYRVLVSEIMLQQTQVPRVKIVFRDFLERFPKIEDLASANNKDVLLAWRRMGYNSRALRLRDAARVISERGSFPREMKDLMNISGIGHYTAAAVRNFAFDLPTPCIDTNIRRILHRAFIGAENTDGTWKKDDKYILDLATSVLDQALSSQLLTLNSKLSTSNWHAALMDFGSLVCTKRSPKWDDCPLTKKGLMKAAYKVKDPIKKRKKEPGRMVGSTFIPNRIFRGKVVEELRNEEGLTLEQIGRRTCIDWDQEDLTPWLTELVEKLKSDNLITQSGKTFALSS